MRRAATIVALLLLVAAVQSYVNLGDACYYDEECDTITTFCRDRRVCSCKERFREAEGRCVATVGARCSSTYDCSSLESSHCLDRECVCREGYVKHSSDNFCLSVIYLFQGACEEDTQCQESFGDRALCRNTMCECMDGSHWADGACWHSKGLGESCFNVSECSYDQSERFRVRCVNSECVCRPGDRRNDRICEDGAAQVTLSLVGVFFIVIVRVFIS